jgi:signal transduction histidine kinase
MSSQNGVATVMNGSVEKTVFFTPYHTLEPIKQTDKAGTGAYLIKPLNLPELEQSFISDKAPFNDMVELRRLNSQLQARNEELEAFAYTVAHQLKNSSCLVTLFGKILKESVTLPEMTQEYLEGIIQNGHKMNNIINELQLLAGLGKGSMELKPLNMGEIVASARQRLTHTIEERQAQIITPETWPMTWGYGPWVEEVWVNFIDNALKYGGEPPRIELGATLQADKYVRFWIHDNGPGLPPGKQAEIFKPFVRFDQIKLEGHGLGLSIVQHIVEKLGGEVEVESQGIEGQGSIFMFTLPQIPDHVN